MTGLVATGIFSSGSGVSIRRLCDDLERLAMLGEGSEGSDDAEFLDDYAK